MPFPAGLTLVTVTCQFDLLPDGGSAGSVRIFYDGPLTGAADNSVVPYVDESGTLASGACDIEVPATNDPGWVPSGFAYTVVANFGTHTRRGTLQLNYQTTAVNLADLVQWDGAAVAGTTYATLAQLTDHTTDTTGVHGIADTSALVLTGDSRLSDARTPTAHAASHADGGSDEVSLTGEQITSGTVAYARLPVGTSSSTVAAGDDSRIVAANTGLVRATGHSLVGWTFDPAAGVQGGTVMPTSGLGHVVRIQALSTVLTNIVFDVTVGGSGLTGFYASVHNDAGALIGGAAVTGDESSAMGSAGLKTLALTVAQGLTQYSFYRILFWFTGTTGPTLSRGLASTSGLVTVGQSSAYRFATADSGLVATPPNNLAALSADTAAWWVGAS